MLVVGMLSYVARRLVHGAILLFAASVAIFLLVHLIPGDPAVALAGPDATAEQLARVNEKLGLDQPLPVQFLDWIGAALQGDLGESYVRRLPVAELIGQRWVPTIQLAFLAAIFSLVVAFITGFVSARREGRFADLLISGYNALMISVPGFWLGILGILVFGLYLGWLPVGGYAAFSEDPGQALMYLILPVAAVGLALGAVLSRFVKSSLLEVMEDDHVRAARAKGLREGPIMRRHVLRNALIPVVTVFGLQFGNLLGGAVIIEAVFSWPGLGTLVVDAILARDYPVVQGCLMLLTVIFIAVNLVTDITYGLLDPRVREGYT